MPFCPHSLILLWDSDIIHVEQHVSIGYYTLKLQHTNWWKCLRVMLQQLEGWGLPLFCQISFIHVAKLKTVQTNFNWLNTLLNKALDKLCHDQLGMITSTQMAANLFCYAKHNVNQHQSPSKFSTTTIKLQLTDNTSMTGYQLHSPQNSSLLTQLPASYREEYFFPIAWLSRFYQIHPRHYSIRTSIDNWSDHQLHRMF